jgi:hypothetical protein
MNRFILLLTFCFIAVLGTMATPKAAVIYVYQSAPLTSEFGTALQGDRVTFAFLTPAPLPQNLAFDPTGLVTPTSSVPVLDWIVDVGPYAAVGFGIGNGYTHGSNGLYFLLFDTNSSGDITSWFLELNPITLNRKNLINVTDMSPGLVGTIFGSGNDYAQINPNINGVPYTETALAFTPGTWVGPSAIPEPSTLSLIASGLLGLCLLRRTFKAAATPLAATRPMFGASRLTG